MNKLRIILYFIILCISLTIFLKYDLKRDYEMNIDTNSSFPSENILDDLEKLEIQ